MNRFSAAIGAVAVAAVMASAATAQPSAGLKYVSMGSSYAAGPGVGAPDPASGACARSQSNYAHLLAERRHLSLVDVACSGATTQGVLDHGQYGLAPQIEAVDAQTRLVTVTIGGNDVSYMANMFGYSCRDTGGDCPVVSDAQVDQSFATLPGQMRRIVSEVHRRAPQARLVLIDYLPVAPAGDADDCAAVPLSPQDKARLQAVLKRLTGVLSTVAAETNTPLIASPAIGAGHGACSNEPYLAGFKPTLTPGWPRGVGYHPNQKGMEALADALDKTLPPEATRP